MARKKKGSKYQNKLREKEAAANRAAAENKRQHDEREAASARLRASDPYGWRRSRYNTFSSRSHETPGDEEYSLRKHTRNSRFRTEPYANGARAGTFANIDLPEPPKNMRNKLCLIEVQRTGEDGWAIARHLGRIGENETFVSESELQLITTMPHEKMMKALKDWAEVASILGNAQPAQIKRMGSDGNGHRMSFGHVVVRKTTTVEEPQVLGHGMGGFDDDWRYRR